MKCLHELEGTFDWAGLGGVARNGVNSFSGIDKNWSLMNDCRKGHRCIIIVIIESHLHVLVNQAFQRYLILK